MDLCLDVLLRLVFYAILSSLFHPQRSGFPQPPPASLSTLDAMISATIGQTHCKERLQTGWTLLRDTFLPHIEAFNPNISLRSTELALSLSKPRSTTSLAILTVDESVPAHVL